MLARVFALEISYAHYDPWWCCWRLRGITGSNLIYWPSQPVAKNVCSLAVERFKLFVLGFRTDEDCNYVFEG